MIGFLGSFVFMPVILMFIGHESFSSFCTRDNNTLYDGADDKIIEKRGILYIDEYSYNGKGRLEFMTRRNRKGQPICRRTPSYTYYQ